MLLEAASGSSELIQICSLLSYIITSIHKGFQEHTGILKTSVKNTLISTALPRAWREIRDNAMTCPHLSKFNYKSVSSSCLSSSYLKLREQHCRFWVEKSPFISGPFSIMFFHGVGEENGKGP